jgi:hypothetical protein
MWKEIRKLWHNKSLRSILYLVLMLILMIIGIIVIYHVLKFAIYRVYEIISFE